MVGGGESLSSGRISSTQNRTANAHHAAAAPQRRNESYSSRSGSRVKRSDKTADLDAQPVGTPATKNHNTIPLEDEFKAF